MGSIGGPEFSIDASLECEYGAAAFAISSRRFAGVFGSRSDGR
jgi:hypothetical protein